ncbi:MAG: UDP-N-acetylmuramoyl-L-alanyl-D-glutamate--2,6-diaminopimelate ligase [Candidatus Delongbacteria bacterium]
MKLSSIIANIPVIDVKNFAEKDISGVTSDSREKIPFSVFVAVKGLTGDGAEFSKDAVGNGAVAVVYETEISEMIEGVTYIKVNNTRSLQSEIAAMVYNHPSEELDITAVTGTNGKTSFAYIYRHILKDNNIKCGMIGTTEYDLGSVKFVPVRTTPDAVFLQRHLSQMKDSKLSDAVMEVSSHALVLQRVKKVKFRTAVFTNLTRDHLDFHKNMDEYADAKAELFSKYLKKNGVSVINADDPYAQKMIKAAPYKVLTFSQRDNNSDLYIKNISYNKYMEIEFVLDKEPFLVKTKLKGSFQAMNIAPAILCALQKKIPLTNIIRSLAKDIIIPGRMETVYRKEFTVIVDYAHTPDALRSTIRALKATGRGRVITVFGCGGNRDTEKRELMGNIASENSDIAIVTSDNPRYEDNDSIIKDIIKKIEKDNYIVIPDRKKAIEKAVRSAKKDDIVLIAGKGHEDYQEINGVKYPFSDIKAAGSILEEEGS